jgi:hypothetical protein
MGVAVITASSTTEYKNPSVAMSTVSLFIYGLIHWHRTNVSPASQAGVLPLHQYHHGAEREIRTPVNGLQNRRSAN